MNFDKIVKFKKNVVKNLIMLPAYPSYGIKQVDKNISLINKYFEYL